MWDDLVARLVLEYENKFEIEFESINDRNGLVSYFHEYFSPSSFSENKSGLLSNNENSMNVVKLVRILTRDQSFVTNITKLSYGDEKTLFNSIWNHHKQALLTTGINEYTYELVKSLRNVLLQLKSTENIKKEVHEDIGGILKFLSSVEITMNTMEILKFYFSFIHLLVNYDQSVCYDHFSDIGLLRKWLVSLFHVFKQACESEPEKKVSTDVCNNTLRLLDSFFIMCYSIFRAFSKNHQCNYCVILNQEMADCIFSFIPCFKIISDLHFSSDYSKEPFCSTFCNFMTCMTDLKLESEFVQSILKNDQDENIMEYMNSHLIITQCVPNLSFLLSFLEFLVQSAVEQKQSYEYFISNKQTNKAIENESVKDLFSLDHYKLINISLVKFCMGLQSMCTQNMFIRNFFRFHVIPPLKSADIRPEEEKSLRGRFANLMATTDQTLNTALCELLFCICKNSTGRMIKYFGMGNCMGFLHQRGFLSSCDVEASDHSSSDNEEYAKIKDQVNPITGAVNKKNETLNSMSEEQKENEFNMLISDIAKLQSLNVIKPVGVTKDGELKELKDFDKPRNEDKKQT